MPEQLPFKKEYLLAGAAIVLLLLGYQLAFKKTIKVWQLNHRLNLQLARSSDVSIQPQFYQRKDSNLERIINLYKKDSIAFRSKVINIVSSIAESENARLSELPAHDPLLRNDTFIVEKLKFEGTYFSLVKVLYRLIDNTEIGIIRSAEIKSIKTRSNSKREKDVVLDVYIEIINK